MRAQNVENDHYRPCLILAHTDAAYAALAGRAFRRLGWDVYQARTGPEARRLAHLLGPELVVLDTDLPEESGWLTCDKLVRERAALQVLLVSPDPAPWGEDFAFFVGARALVGRAAGTAVLVRNATRPAWPVAV